MLYTSLFVPGLPSSACLGWGGGGAGIDVTLGARENGTPSSHKLITGELRLTQPGESKVLKGSAGGQHGDEIFTPSNGHAS